MERIRTTEITNNIYKKCKVIYRWNSEIQRITAVIMWILETDKMGYDNYRGFEQFHITNIYNRVMRS